MEHPIQFPTYEEHIHSLFTSDDVGCMIWKLNLESYEGVVEKANEILSRVKAGTMPPPEEDRRWSAEKVQTFENWIDNGFQRVRAYLVNRPNKSVVRKDLLDLSTQEISLLKKAFQGLRDRDSDVSDKFSLFNLAGVHWYPGPRKYIHCRHHDNEYNTWHRAYLIVFENALRSIEDCENVTLPYWDILGDKLPKWVYEEPFYPYPYAHDLLNYDGTANFKSKDDPIERFSADRIRNNIFDRLSPVSSSINKALSAPTWEKFNGWSGNISTHDAIIEAHDNGHGDCGATIGNPATAAFDPLFWFFHCNWDRLWWEWQKQHNAISLDIFKTKLEEDDGWLDDRSSNILKPFNVHSHHMINLNDWDIEYESPISEEIFTHEPFILASGSVLTDKSFKIASLDTVSIRIKNINRLKIPGSFKIDLLVNKEIIRSTSVFQPVEVNECGNCQKRGIFSKDFLVQRHEIPDGADIEVEIKRLLDDGGIENVPLSSVGNPSLNIRLLLDQ